MRERVKRGERRAGIDILCIEEGDRVNWGGRGK